jgi:hypothetical protein
VSEMQTPQPDLFVIFPAVSQNRIQLTSDGLRFYAEAVEAGFGEEVITRFSTSITVKGRRATANTARPPVVIGHQKGLLQGQSRPQ